MLTAYERHLLASYLANAASGLHHRDREASALAEWVADRENRVTRGRRRKRSRLHGTELDPEEGMSARNLRRIEEALWEECSGTSKARRDRTAERLRCLGKTAGLNTTDLRIIELLLRYQTQPIIESMVDDVFGRTGRHINPLNIKGSALSVLLGISANTVHSRFRNDAPLVRSGLVSIDNDGDLILVTLAERVANLREPRVSLCLQGPPGTGKSAFVRYLAEKLGLEVIQRRASDLMSMWVGGTEQRIAAAFAEASDAGAFLVFDEADSLLADTRFARRTWEVSQVNEMLTWMESHPLPFACTTNFGEHLDPATLRRFVFKVTLDYLTPAQVEAAFRGYFALPAPAELAALTALTPGDFAVVHRKAEILGGMKEPAALLAMLRAECEAKPDRPRAIGFLR